MKDDDGCRYVSLPWREIGASECATCGDIEEVVHTDEKRYLSKIIDVY
jgi:hypothetical protein